MSFLIFGTSIVFAVDKHMCEEEVWSISFFGKAETCKKAKKVSETEMLSCCELTTLEKRSSNQGTQLSKEPCCSQETFVNNVQIGKEKPSLLVVGQGQTAVLTDLSKSYMFSVCSTEKKAQVLRPPPDLGNNFQSLLQVFII